MENIFHAVGWLHYWKPHPILYSEEKKAYAMTYVVDYRYGYEPIMSRSFDTFDEAEAFADYLRWHGWDAIIDDSRDKSNTQRTKMKLKVELTQDDIKQAVIDYVTKHYSINVTEVDLKASEVFGYMDQRTGTFNVTAVASE